MDRPDWVMRMNFLGDAVGGARHLIDLNPDELMKTAMRNTRLADFGGTDWLPGYHAALNTLNDSDILHTIGRLLIRGFMLRSLQNRLLVTEKFKQCPDIHDETIESPIFIVGNPRTGTTILFELLAQDPRFRAPLAWEASNPLPLPEHLNTANISQGEVGQCVNDLMIDIQPMMRPMHDLRWDIPAECLQIMEINCIPRFTEYDETAIVDTISTANNYHWHKKVLQVLQYEKEKKTWLLKCPSHLNFIDRILECYPDARFVFTHRDPAKSAPSILQLVEYYNSIFTHQGECKDPIRMLSYLKEGTRHLIQQRTSGAIASRPVADMLFQDLMKDPIKTTKKLYDRLELPLIEGMEQRILDYLECKPRYKHGEYRYSAEKYGITTSAIRDLFAEYIAFYEIPLENN